MKLEVKCLSCRKKPRNCTCFEYRISKIDNDHAVVFVDNVCTEPVYGEVTGTWRPRANAKEIQRPIMEDGFGPVLYINGGENHRLNKETVKVMIEEGTFHYEKFLGLEGFRVRSFEREVVRRCAFLRRPRQARTKAPERV